MEEARETLKVVFAGHVDHGKSTVIGRLLLDTGAIAQGAVDKARAAAKEAGQPFEFAYLLDALEEERKQGVTIDIAKIRFRTAKRDYLVIDAPGHREFLKNMISGAADAEAAFLVVDAERGVEEQSLRHAHALSLLGARRVGVIVNKMDLVGYREEAFARIRAEITAYLGNLEIDAFPVVPLSAKAGENIVTRSELMPWSASPPLSEAMDELERDRSDESLRLPTQDVYKFDGRRIVAGRVESGGLQVGDRVVVSPGKRETQIRALASWPPAPEKVAAREGESVGLILADEFFHRRGEIISHLGDPPQVADSIKASLFWLGRAPLARGKKYKLKLATAAVEATVAEIVSVTDSQTLNARPGAPEVGANEVAQIWLSLKEKIALDPFSRHRATGRFVLVDGYDVAGGGIVLETRALAAAAGFLEGEISARSEIFAEYFYRYRDGSIVRENPAPRVFAKGDKVPLRGISYSYPASFDVAIFRDRAAVLIREGAVADIMPLEKYSYGGFPLVNGRGFAIKAGSAEEWEKARDALLGQGPPGALGSVGSILDFNVYRKIALGGDL
ncbi:MAG: 50S ribosome-binding GTPase [Deltaproteobacteria bacterium]|jgi:small GTP-binding protein|nr:50S ribosome-binding GTPase [Deltaproteobacteria bacterium]